MKTMLAASSMNRRVASSRMRCSSAPGWAAKSSPCYNKRLRAVLELFKQVIRELAADNDFWFERRLDRRLHARRM